MKKNDSIILVGGFHEIYELCETSNIDILGVFDANAISFEPFKIQYLGTDLTAKKEIQKFKNNKVVIIPDSPILREKLHKKYNEFGYSFGNIVSEKSIISKYSNIGIGVVIQNNCNVSVNAEIGDFTKLNVSANVMHDSKIGDYSTIAPNSVILGNVIIGKRCYIGTNSTILPGVSICSDVTVGAGSVVTRNITIPGIYIGSPAKKINKA
jgi:UDP-N-acetylbacillosamine N-acetyltransferase